MLRRIGYGPLVFTSMAAWGICSLIASSGNRWVQTFAILLAIGLQLLFLKLFPRWRAADAVANQNSELGNNE
jgi:hypothetical protein